MKTVFLFIVCMGSVLFAPAQKKLGLLEYTANTTAAIRATGANGETVQATGLFFLFNTPRGGVTSIITSRSVVEQAQTLTFCFLEANTDHAPRYDKPQQLTIRKSELRIINHPDSGVDLVVIPIASLLSYFSQRKIEISYHPVYDNVIATDTLAQTFKPEEEVVLVGHPAALQQAIGHTAILKHGTTARAPFLDYDGKKQLLLNLVAYEGAAGAPVYIYQNSNIDRADRRMDGQRVLLAGIVLGRETKSLVERSGQPDLTLAIKAARILEFRKILNEIR